MTLPLALKVRTSRKPSSSKRARRSSLEIRWPPTFIPRRNAAYPLMQPPYCPPAIIATPATASRIPAACQIRTRSPRMLTPSAIVTSG